MSLLKAGWPYAAAICSGLLATLCFPPYNQAWLAWICLAPLLAALWYGIPANSSYVGLRAFALGYLFGLVHFYTVFHWISTVTVLGWIIFIPYLAIYPAAWAWFASLLGNPSHPATSNSPVPLCNSWHNLLLAAQLALAWIGLEWLRGWMFTGFGWNQLGVSMHQQLLLIQVAELAGVAAVSFKIVMANVIAVLTVARLLLETSSGKVRPHYDFNLTVALVVASFIFGISTIDRQPEESQTLRIAAVQPDIPQNQSWSPQFQAAVDSKLDRLTDAALAANPDLLIWPEASTPLPVLSSRSTYARIRAIVDQLPPHSVFLLGSLDYTDQGDFNAAMFFTGNPDETSFYYKLHLVPFGEYIPFRTSFPLFAWVVGDLVPHDFNAGNKPVVFRMPENQLKLAPLICFEDSLDRLVRKFMPLQPHVLVNLTNDGWFLESAASKQHLANAIFRCVEFRRPMLRCANNGVTACIDSSGRVTHILSDEQGSTFIDGVLVASLEIPLDTYNTPFTATGNILPVTALALTILLVATRIFPGILKVKRR